MNGETARRMLIGVLSIAQAYYTLVLVISVLVGLILVFVGALGFVRASQNGTAYGAAATEVFIGAVFFNLPTFLNELSASIMGVSAADNPLNYSIASESSGFHSMLSAALAIITAVGMWGVVRGLWLARETAYDRKLLWPTLTHLVFGCIAMNITTFASMLDNSFGNVLSSSLYLFSGGVQ